MSPRRRPSRRDVRRGVQLVVACVVLGIGVGLVLSAGLGSDGYSSLVNGVSRTTGLPYAPVNWVIGFALVAIAWWCGVRPGPGTLTHPLVVGTSVNVVLDVVPAPSGPAVRGLLLVAGVLLLALGVAAYLEADLGAGPFESATFALKRVPFRLAYTVLQAVGAVAGWLLGASIGIGTLVVVFGTGPVVGLIRDAASGRRRAEPT